MDDFRWKQRANLLESVILVSDVLQQCRRRLAFLSWKSEFHHQPSVEFGVMDGTDAVTLCSFAPSKVGTCRVQHGDEERGNAKGNRGDLRIFKEGGRPSTEEARDCTDDDDWEVNPRPTERVECLGSLVAPCQTVCLLTRGGKILFERGVPSYRGGCFGFAHCFQVRRNRNSAGRREVWELLTPFSRPLPLEKK